MDQSFFSQASIFLASLAAVAAGLISFFSPCVLPLVPSFLGYITGTVARPAGTLPRWHGFLHTLAFVLGFAFIFVIVVSRLGLLFELLYRPADWITGWPAAVLAWPLRPPFLYIHLVQKAAGIFLVLFGLHTTGLLRLRLFDLEKRPNIPVSRRLGYLSSFLIGITFAVGWTPCVAAPLAGILALGSNAPGTMVFLLALYSLGLGLPFLALGLFVERAAAFVQRTMRYRRAIAIASGVLLIAIGLAVFFGQLALLGRLPAWF